jgi:hypothetical protein
VVGPAYVVGRHDGLIVTLEAGSAAMPAQWLSIGLAGHQ